jgi:hypothetical protein
MKHVLFTALVIACSVRVFAQQDLPPDAPIAKVGRQTITNWEFLTRYELTPGLQRHMTGRTDEKKAELLFTLIAEKLLAQQAREAGLDRDPNLLNAVFGVERLFVRDELYRREVRGKVSVTPKELEQAMRYAQEDRKVYFLYAKTQRSADSLFALIKRGKPLESFSFTPSQHDFEGPDSAITRWGDADERMEAAVYGLRLGETAPPLKLDDGYYIPKLMGKSMTIAIGEKEKKAAAERVEQTLRKRKEQKRMFEFMASVLKNEKAEVKAKLSKDVITELFAAYEASVPVQMRQADTAKFVLTSDIVSSILLAHQDAAEAPYVTFSNSAWTLKTTLDKMRISGLAITHPTLNRVRTAYEERLKDLIDQEHLTEIGYQRGLQHTTSVQKELGPWRDWFLAQSYKNTVEDTVSVSTSELENEKWRLLKDTLSVKDTSKARANIVAMKMRYFTDRRLGALAEKYGITIFEKNVSAVNVTQVPAMVYRYLGFGGRMFAVPLTEPNIQWVNFWDRKNLRLP